MTARVPGLLAALVLAAAAIGGCGGSSPGSAGLPGSQWELDIGALGGAGGSEVSSFLAFGQDARVHGNDGCNDFSGAYQSDGTALRLGPLAATQRACAGPAQEVAAKVGPALERVRSFEQQADTLVLQDADGEPLLRYRASTPAVAGGWTAVSVLYDDAIRGVIEGATPTADFAAGGKVSGSGGCNTFSGPYETGGARLRIGPLAATRKVCPRPDGAGAQERGYLAALESVVRFEQAGTKLTLFNARGQMAVTFERRR